MGLPSWKRAWARRVKATHERSAGTSMVSAISPYCENGSSWDSIVSVSKIPAMPAAGTPRTTKGFSVSKLPGTPSLTSPPFGASGLTYWKCLKPAGYLRSPCIESPWPPVTFGAVVWAPGDEMKRSSPASVAAPSARMPLTAKSRLLRRRRGGRSGGRRGGRSGRSGRPGGRRRRPGGRHHRGVPRRQEGERERREHEDHRDGRGDLAQDRRRPHRAEDRLAPAGAAEGGADVGAFAGLEEDDRDDRER